MRFPVSPLKVAEGEGVGDRLPARNRAHDGIGVAGRTQSPGGGGARNAGQLAAARAGRELGDVGETGGDGRQAAKAIRIAAGQGDADVVCAVGVVQVVSARPTRWSVIVTLQGVRGPRRH